MFFCKLKTEKLVSIPEMVRLIVYAVLLLALVEPCFNSRDGAIDRREKTMPPAVLRSFNSRDGAIDRNTKNVL